jgi:hypothetical protein
MKYYKFVASTPFAGTENTFYHCMEEPLSEQELESLCTDYSHDNAEAFDYLVFGWCYDPVEEGEMTEEEYEQEMENYYCDCSCTWEEISEEKFKEALGID